MFQKNANSTKAAQNKKMRIPTFRKTSSQHHEKAEVCLKLPAKFYGYFQVTQPRSDSACETALALIKARLLAPKTHKPHVSIELHSDKFVVKRSKMTLSNFAYSDMMYIWSDPTDSRSCGLVFRRSTLGEYWYEFYGYKLDRGPSRLIGALKHIFCSLPTPIDAEKKEENVSEVNKASVDETKILPVNDSAQKVQPKKELFVHDLLDLEEKLDTLLIEKAASLQLDTQDSWSTPTSTKEDPFQENCANAWAKFDEPHGKQDRPSGPWLQQTESAGLNQTKMPAMVIDELKQKQEAPRYTMPSLASSQWTYQYNGPSQVQWASPTNSVAPQAPNYHFPAGYMVTQLPMTTSLPLGQSSNPFQHVWPPMGQK